MAQIILYPSDPIDVGYCDISGDFYTGGYSGSYCEVGSNSSGSDLSWIRIALDIPPLATVSSAILHLTAYSEQSGTTCTISIGGNDYDAQTIFTSSTQLFSLEVSTTVAGFTVGAWTAGTSYDFDITAVIQDLVNREDFSAGNKILLLLSNNGSDSGAYRQFDSVAYNDGANKPTLTVEYTSFTIDAVSPCAEFSMDSGAQIEAFAPACDFVMLSGAAISGDIPTPTVSIWGGRTFSIRATAPAPRVALATGATIAATLPTPSVALTGTLRIKGNISCTSPAPLFSMNTAAGISCVAPAASVVIRSGALLRCEAAAPVVEIEATTHALVRISGNIPCPQVAINALTGAVARLECQCPPAMVLLSNLPTTTAKMVGVFPGARIDIRGTEVVVGALQLRCPAPIVRIHALSMPTWAVEVLNYDPTRVA